MLNKFINKEHMIIVRNYDTAAQILRHPSFIVPDLIDYLDRLAEATGHDFAMLRLFVNSSPFFLEGSRHALLRKVGSSFLSSETYAQWQPFFQREIDIFINDLSDLDEFDLVEKIGVPIFSKLLKPFLGIHPVDTKAFDSKAMVLQRLIEPMLSIRKLQQVNTDLMELMESLQPDSPKISHDSMLYRLLQGNDELSVEEKKAYTIVLYAAVAPLAQTIINILVNLYEGESETTPEQFYERVDTHIWKSAAPIFIHRMATHDIEVNGLNIKTGNTVLIEIGSSFKEEGRQKNEKPAAVSAKNFAFGQGVHHCLGALFSRNLILEIVPRFLTAYPKMRIKFKKADDANHIARAYESVIVEKN